MDGQTGTMTGGAVAPANAGTGSANSGGGNPGGGATGAQAAEYANPGSQGGRASGTGGEPGGETALAAMKEIFSQGEGVNTDGGAKPGGETANSGETGARAAGDGKADSKKEPGEEKKEAGAGKKEAGKQESDGKAVDPLDQPITDWEKVEIAGEFDPQILREFGEKAVALGLTARQAQTLAQFELEAARAARERILDAGTRELQAEWGGEFQARCKSVLGLFSNIDRALGDSSFSEALNASGAACHPAFIRGMARVAELLEEDSLAARHGGALAAREETPYEGLVRIFGPGKRRQG